MKFELQNAKGEPPYPGYKPVEVERFDRPILFPECSHPGNFIITHASADGEIFPLDKPVPVSRSVSPQFPANHFKIREE